MTASEQSVDYSGPLAMNGITVMTVNFYARLDKIDAGCSKSRHTVGHH